jgi:hypothetical protein
LYRFAEKRDTCIDPAGLTVDNPEQVIRLGIIRVSFQNILTEPPCLLKLPGVKMIERRLDCLLCFI